jgi:hypothetical protein
MKAATVEVVFVVDASESMRPCFEGLAKNLDQIVKPLQGFDLKVRLGLIAMSLGKTETGGRLVRTETLAGGVEEIYRGGTGLFTEDGAAFSARLHALQIGGDENHLIALDCALDFPFGPVAATRRVVALFGDERIEDGLLGEDDISKVPALVTKIMARRIQFFGALPISPALEQLATADSCQVEEVSGGDGLANVDFRKLLAQMAKSISGTSLQGGEERYQRGLFGQEQWQTGSGSFDGLR